MPLLLNASHHLPSLNRHAPAFLPALPADGALIYSLLGAHAEASFVRQWAIGVGLENLTEWNAILREGIKVAVVLVLFDRLGYIGGEPWLEVHVDSLSIHATMFHGRAMTWLQSMREHMSYVKRIEMK